LERARIAMDVMMVLGAAGWQVGQEITAKAVIFRLTHAGLPGLAKEVYIEEVRTRRFTAYGINEVVNVLTLRGSRFSTMSLDKATIGRLISILENIKRAALVLRQYGASAEEAARHCGEQQARDLAGVVLPGWMTPEIRVMGAFAGRYKVTFDEGCLMERLTTEQVIKLAELLHSFDVLQETAATT